MSIIVYLLFHSIQANDFLISKSIRFVYEWKSYELTAVERQNRKVNVRYSADLLSNLE